MIHLHLFVIVSRTTAAPARRATRCCSTQSLLTDEFSRCSISTTAHRSDMSSNDHNNDGHGGHGFAGYASGTIEKKERERERRRKREETKGGIDGILHLN